MANGSGGGDTLQTIGFQLAMAFGQGAGAMLATSGALLAAYQPYESSFKERTDTWSEFEVRALHYARALGQVAATRAAQSGRCVIDVEDVKYALDTVQRNTLKPLSLCDLTPRGGKPGGSIV